MELYTWITDFIVFFREIIIIGIVFLIYRLLTGRIDFSSPDGRIIFNRSNRNYRTNRSNGNSYYYDDDDNQHFYSNPNNEHNYSYSHYHDDDDEDSARTYDGLTGTGDFIMNGSMDEPLDFTNPNHYPIIDSYDTDKN